MRLEIARWLRSGVLAGAGCALACAARAETVADSGGGRVALIELYSSEGCSSCPPAERWLGGLKDQPGLWRDFVPVAFPVDYWDGLGWKDPFATPANTARQRRYAAEWKTETTYTPEFVLDGAEWRGGSVPAASGNSPGRLRVEALGEGRFRLEFSPRDPSFSGGEAHLALLGFDRVSQVQAGENAGRRLAHDFVALATGQGDLAPADGAWTATLRLPVQRDGRQALAAWISLSGHPAPLQAAGGWIVSSPKTNPTQP